VGYLAQEPELDASKTVMENVMEGVAEKKDLVDRFNAVSEQFSDADADFDKLMEEQAAIQTKIDGTVDLSRLD
jgi:ATPase subunit of ABC transporter with duplicated ATPase domains